MSKKFKELTDDEKNHIVSVYKDKDNGPWEKRAAELGITYGVSERTIRKWVSEKLNLKEKNKLDSVQYNLAKQKNFNSNKKRFLISWAQNNTPVNMGLLKNMEAYANKIDADIHIIAGRYKNPTSVWSEEQEDNEFWDENVLKYLDANRHDIHKYVSILSDIKIQATAVNPMTGLQALSGVNSCVFGSPKVQLEMIPVLEGNQPKMMVTTGAITEKNYTDSKAGKTGEFHHTFGFVVVEIKDDEIFFIRQVTADDLTGDFTDLYFKVESEKIKTIKKIEAAILGDVHYGHHDQKVLDATFSLFDKLKPKHVILHDVFDGDSISHHQMKDPFIQYGKEMNGTNDLEKEMGVMMDGLKSFEKFKNVVVVRSNHDDFLDRWLKNEDWKKQPTYKNSRLYMKYSDILLEQYGKDPHNVKGVVPSLVNAIFPKYITLGRSSSYKVLGWELGQHGDIGSNGSRGSLLQFRKLNTKIVVGHYHSPGRKDGAISVGTSTHLRVGYNKGASTWLQSHVLIHRDGRAQHINFIKDENGEAHYTTLVYE
jgi:hypothetical protein